MQAHTSVGRRILERRRMLRLSQESLSELTGISQTQISRYEKGENDPTGAALIALADSLETTVDWLLGRDDLPTYLNAEELELVKIFRQKTSEKRGQLLQVAKFL